MGARGVSSFLRNSILLVSLLLGLAGGLAAQVDTGSILGTIKDQTGAVIPGAKVTLTNQGTRLAVATVSSGDGSYAFNPVKIGAYTVAVESAGFQKSSHAGITVSVQQSVVVDFTLVPGKVTETIEVTGAPPVLQTQNVGGPSGRPASDQ